MSKRYIEVLTILQKANGKPVKVTELKRRLGKDFPIGRLSTYMYDIKKYGKKGITTIRNGREAVAYAVKKGNLGRAAKGKVVPKNETIQQSA